MPDRTTPAPFALRLLIAFLAIDGLLRAALIIDDWAHARALALDLYFRGVIVLFYLLIGIQILMRTSAGRVWAAIFFLLYSILELVKYTLHPHLWLLLGVGGRVRTIVSMIVYLGFTAFLLGRRAREYLRG
ncbi:MAG: hypothetical protein JXP34_13155 [Planctomycetes bacterium]|nr:hypothetical protein [Planctomycetota bacterium]